MGIDQDLTITRLARERDAAMASAEEFRQYAAQLEAEIVTIRAELCELRAAAADEARKR